MILVFDEIFLREYFSQYKNIDLHWLERLWSLEEGFETRPTEKAIYGLVLMVQHLADNIHQPIAVFASKGPVKGNFKLQLYKKMYIIGTFVTGIDLAKIILKAILLLENSGI